MSGASRDAPFSPVPLPPPPLRRWRRTSAAPGSSAPRRRAASRDARGRDRLRGVPQQVRRPGGRRGRAGPQAQPQPGLAEVARDAVRPRQRRRQVGLRPGPGQAAAHPGRRPGRGEVARRSRGTRRSTSPRGKLTRDQGAARPRGRPLVLHRGVPGGVLQEPRPGLRLAQHRPPPDALPGLGEPGLLDDVRHRAVVRPAQRRLRDHVGRQPLRVDHHARHHGPHRVDHEPQGEARLPRPPLHGHRLQGRRVVPDPARHATWRSSWPCSTSSSARSATTRSSWRPTATASSSSREHVQAATRRSGPRPRPRSRPRDIVRIAREFADAAPRAVYYAGRRSSWYVNDFQMRRAQAILNAIVGIWDREGGVVPNAKIALGEYLFLPWDEPTAPRVDEIEQPLPAGRQGRRRLPAGARERAGRHAVPGQGVDGLQAGSDERPARPGPHPEDDRADGLRRRHRHPDERHGVVRRRGPAGVDLPRAARPAARAARDLAGGGDAPAGRASRSTTPAPTSRSCRGWRSASGWPTTSTTPSSSGSRSRPRSCRSTTPSST